MTRARHIMGVATLGFLVLSCEPDPETDKTVTGVDLTIRNPLNLDITRVDIVGKINDVVAFGPESVPEEERRLGVEESVVVLLDPGLDGEIIDLELTGVPSEVEDPIPTGSAQITVAERKLTEATVTLLPPCGNGVCAADENSCNCPADCDSVCDDGCCAADENECTCALDCDRECGDGCCTSPPENNNNCPEDCP